MRGSDGVPDPPGAAAEAETAAAGAGIEGSDAVAPYHAGLRAGTKKKKKATRKKAKKATRKKAAAAPSDPEKEKTVTKRAFDREKKRAQRAAKRVEDLEAELTALKAEKAGEFIPPPDPRKVHTREDALEYAHTRIRQVHQMMRRIHGQDLGKEIQLLEKEGKVFESMLRHLQPEPPKKQLVFVGPTRITDMQAFCDQHGVRMNTGDPIPPTCQACGGRGVVVAPRGPAPAANARAG